MKSSLLAIALFCAGVSARAQSLEEFHLDVFRQAAQASDRLARSCDDCTYAGSPDADPACRATYARLFSQSAVNIHVAFGYMDISEGQDAVYAGHQFRNGQSVDGYGADAFARMIQAPCSTSLGGACGFRPQNREGRLYIKTVPQNGRTVEIRLHLTHASATLDLATNQGVYKSEQQVFTKAAEKNFFDSLDGSDLSVYTGHARAGGGPDFRPPVLRADGNPDYEGLYLKDRPGWTRLLKSLRGASRPPALLAILGCNSDKLFRRELRTTSPRTGLVTLNNLTDFEAVFRETFLVVDSFLKRACGSTFQRNASQLSSQTGADAILTAFPRSE